MTEQTSKAMAAPENAAEYDSLVVGAGLVGVCAAALLAKSGKRVCLVEAQDRVGGRWSPERRDGFQLGAGLNVADAQAWRVILNALDLNDLSVAIENGGALVSTKRGWQAKTELPTWEKFLARSMEIMPRGGVAGFLEHVNDKQLFETRLNAPITELWVNGGKAVWARVGATDTVRFSHCVWATDAHVLADVICGESAPEEGTERTAWLQQFILHTASPGVVLEFAHNKKVSDFTETLLLPLPGAEKEKDRRYLVGAFLTNRDESLAPKARDISVWLLPLREEEWEDNHEIMKRIRSARRMIEKSFPKFEASILFDRVQVLSHTFTPASRKSKQKSKDFVQPFANLQIFSDWATPGGSHFPAVVERFASEFNLASFAIAEEDEGASSGSDSNDLEVEQEPVNDPLVTDEREFAVDSSL